MDNRKDTSFSHTAEFLEMQIKAIGLYDGLADATALSGFLLDAIDTLGLEDDSGLSGECLRGLRVASRALRDRHCALRTDMRALCGYFKQARAALTAKRP